MAAAALLAGALVGAGAGEEDAPGPGSPPPATGVPAPDGRPAERAPVDALTLEQQAGQTIVLRFAGTRVPAYVRRALRERRVAGAILFRDNVEDPAQLRRLARALRRGAGDLAPVVCVDQEGGAVRILPWAPPERSQPAQAQAGTVAADASAAGEALRAAGVNVTLAPVADVPTGAGSAVAGRGFGTDADAAAEATAAAVRAWRAAGVAPTLKHFPGLGASAVNTDDAPATVRAPEAEIAAGLAPFRAGIEAGAPLVMLSHASYPALDPERIASQSPAVARDLLRDALGFRGVAITDSLEAAAVSSRWPVEEAGERSLRAGADLLLTTGRGSYIALLRHLIAEARRSPALRERIREAAARVLALRGGLDD